MRAARKMRSGEWVLSQRDRIVCTVVSTALALACQSLLLLPICIALLWTTLQPAAAHSQPKVLTVLLGVLMLALIVV